MVIQPVDSAQERFGRLASGDNRPAEGNAFARIFAASVDKENPAGGQTEKVAEAAEILRLEMMKSAVSFSGTGPEPATPTLYGGDLDSTLAAYNWGPGNVDRSHGAFLPRETREYLVKVKKYYSQFVG